MTANIDIVTGKLDDALYLPVESIDHQLGRDVVRVRRGTELVEQPVTISHRTETEAVLLEEPAAADGTGLREGDQVVMPMPGSAATPS
jgi:hypothetical protein